MRSSNVTDMNLMFSEARAFNQDTEGGSATVFNEDPTGWCVMYITKGRTARTCAGRSELVQLGHQSVELSLMSLSLVFPLVVVPAFERLS